MMCSGPCAICETDIRIDERRRVVAELRRTLPADPAISAALDLADVPRQEPAPTCTLSDEEVERLIS